MDDDEATADVHYSTEDLFELVWQAAKGGGSGGGGGSSSLQQSSSSCQVVPAIPPLASPPSEDVMAAWLYPIVTGQDQDHATGGDTTLGQTPLAKEASKGIMLGTKDTNTSEKKASGSGSASRKASSHHYSRAHNLTEKKRRCRINEKLRTLQRLIPGCDKSNQVSTLERTIQYINSLQQQVQVMMNTWPAPPPALYPPFAMPMPPTAAPGTPAQMVPLGAMLPYPHYQTVTMPAAAAGAPQLQSGAAPGAPAGRRLCPRHKNGSRESRS